MLSYILNVDCPNRSLAVPLLAHSAEQAWRMGRDWFPDYPLTLALRSHPWSHPQPHQSL
ncbi:hypothetical protein [Vulcanococcus sp.]|jgi:hypothetical protein|uniref:hypothetical protein n=1 Tax=Vulcanococcus sp. TaxID=2856995 RepID=UPI00322800D3